MSSQARYGWSSNFPSFRAAEPRVVRGRLQDFLPDVDVSQVRAWDDSIPKLQREVAESLDADAGSNSGGRMCCCWSAAP
jgi:hypothetical protein